MIITSGGTINAGSIGLLPVKKGGNINFGGTKREPVTGSNAMLGHTEEFIAPGIKVTTVDTTDNDKKKLQDFVGENVVYITNNGQQYLLTNAFVANDLDLNLDSGEMEIQFYGDELIQQ